MKRLHPAVVAVSSLATALTLLTGPSPAGAAPSAGPDLVASVTGDDGTAARSGASWGTARAERQTLRKGCRGYAFRYRIDVPGDAWMAEITLQNPAGRNISTRTYESGLQPAAGTRHFRFCSVSTRPGRHTIHLKVTSYDARDQAVRRSQPTTFRIVRR